jgi:hypothetical protein
MCQIDYCHDRWVRTDIPALFNISFCFSVSINLFLLLPGAGLLEFRGVCIAAALRRGLEVFERCFEGGSAVFDELAEVIALP